MAKVRLELRDFEGHPAQTLLDSKAKRIIVKAGRRGGKTVALARFAVERFLRGKRIVYGAPTGDQLERFWFEITQALAPLLETSAFKKDETEHSIERVGTEQRIRAKTAYNADTWRGDKGDLLIFDEWQLMNEDAWYVVGAPMLMDNNGDAIFSYTPPRLRAPSRSDVMSKARDPGHAATMFKSALAEMDQAAKENRTSRWFAISWKSTDNPFLSTQGLENATFDMTSLDYRREILVDEDADEDSGFNLDWLRYYNYAPSNPDAPLDDPTNYLLIEHYVPPRADSNDKPEAQPETIFAGSLELRIIVDPNHAGKQGRCKHAVAVVGFDPQTMMFYLLDEWADSCGYRDMGMKVFAMCEKWGLTECWIEAVASQVYCKLYLEELNAGRKHKIRFNELPKDNRANAKDRRIEALEPYFRNSQFWIHREKSKEFRAEYSSYYRGKMVDVDLIDAIGYAPQLFSLIQKRVVMNEIKKRAEEWQQREHSVCGY